MDGRRSSAALLFLFLALAAGSLAAVAQLHPPAGARYVLVVLQTGRGGNAKLAMRTAGGMSITGFANQGRSQEVLFFIVRGGQPYKFL